jgi:MFS family permease
VKFAFEYLDVGPRGYGLLLSAIAAGAMLGGLMGDRIAARLGPTGAIIISYAIFATTDFVRALLPNIVVVVAMSVTMALAGTVWNVVTVSYRQRVIPSHLFGRVNSAYRFIGTGSIAIGALIGGQLAHVIGLRAPFFIGAAITAVALILALPTLLSEEFVLTEPQVAR